MLDVSGQTPLQEVRRKQQTQSVTAVARVREAGAVEEAAHAIREARTPTVLGPVYTFAQNMGLIQNRTLLIMQSRQIQNITKQSDLFEKDDVRKKFSNALVMVAAHSPEELEIFLLTTQRMARGGYSDRLSTFFDQVTEALAERLKKQMEDDDDADAANPPFPMPLEGDDDLVAQVRHTLEKRFAAARERATAFGIVPGEQPSAKLGAILKAGEALIQDTAPAPETVLDLLTTKE